MPMTAGIIKHRLYLCLLLFFCLFAWIYILTGRILCTAVTGSFGLQSRSLKTGRTANWLQAFPLGIHAAVKTVHANSARILHPHKSRGTLQVIRQPYFSTQIWPVAIVFFTFPSHRDLRGISSNVSRATSLIISLAKGCFQVKTVP